MRLTRQTDYSLRTLMYLAVNSEGLAHVADIASAFRISRNHMVKVAHRLGQLGFVETVRGRAGGLRLSRPPGEIRIGNVVRKTEPDFNLVECFDRDRDKCRISHGCSLAVPLREAQRAFLAALDRYTLADLLAAPATVRQIRAIAIGG